MSMTAREAFAAIGRGEQLGSRRVVLAPAEERAAEGLVVVAEAYGRHVRAGARALAKVGQAYGEALRRDLETLIARLRETRP